MLDTKGLKRRTGNEKERKTARQTFGSAEGG